MTGGRSEPLWDPYEDGVPETWIKEKNPGGGKGKTRGWRNLEILPPGTGLLQEPKDEL